MFLKNNFIIVILRSGTLAMFPLACAGIASAEKLPVWEIGLGGGVLSVPDYRGSSESRIYPYPVIFPVYRGRYLQADEEGIKGLLLESDRVRFDLGYDANVPVRSDNDTRRGMDSLDPTIQIGPALRLKLWSKEAGAQSLIGDVSARAAFAVGSGIRHIGYTAFPKISYRRKVDLFDRTWKWNLSGGLLFGSQGYHRYYYQVDPIDATSERPAYKADAGYGGIRLVTTLYHRDRNKLIGFFAAYDNVGDAVFYDSPLVSRESGFTVGFLVSWFFFQSRNTVEVKQWEWSK